MAIPKFLEDLLIISKLGDNPGADNGLSSSGLRAKFDESGVKIQQYINNTLIPALSELADPTAGLNMKGNISMGGHRVTRLGDPVEDGDAVPLGYANGHFAPAGYGLGGNGAPISWADVDNVNGNGWYLVASATPITINGISFAYALLESKTFDANAGKQVLHPIFLNGVVLERYCEGNVWGIWKSPNPRMDTGVEYATTEMLNGVTIYKKRDSNGNVLYRAEGSGTWRNYADLVGAAPRGFGLGGDCVTITTLAELDAIITNGWYNAKLSEPLVVSGASIEYAYMHVAGYDDNWVQQEIYPMLSGCTSKLVRKRYGGAGWREPRWENPPMELGVEYPTTKVWKGKTVYTKAVSVGNLPNATTKTVEGIVKDGCTEIIHASTRGTYSTLSVLPWTDGTFGWLDFISTSDLSGYSEVVTLEYTKD